jgi:hypothetical protein
MDLPFNREFFRLEVAICDRKLSCKVQVEINPSPFYRMGESGLKILVPREAAKRAKEEPRTKSLDFSLNFAVFASSREPNGFDVQ